MPRTTIHHEPIPATLCGCPSCQKKAGYPGITYPSTSAFTQVGGHYGTRQWEAGGRGPLYLGMELELSNAGASAWRHACSYLGRGTLAEVKPDGGMMELTSHPMSPAYFMGHYPWRMLGELRDRNVYAEPDRGGIHVHVNKTAFDGAVHIFNWMQFFYANPWEMTALGGRTQQGTRGGRHFQTVPSRDALMRLAEQVAAQVELHNARHWAATHAVQRDGRRVFRAADRARIRAAEARQALQPYGRWGEAAAINVRRHTETFEVRFPGAAIEPWVVKSRLQLVAAAAEFTRTLQNGDDQNLRFPLFADWAAANRYPELSAAVATL
jgi:hypothetical protein